VIDSAKAAAKKMREVVMPHVVLIVASFHGIIAELGH
jgi:hypothetical protein